MSSPNTVYLQNKKMCKKTYISCQTSDCLSDSSLKLSIGFLLMSSPSSPFTPIYSNIFNILKHREVQQSWIKSMISRPIKVITSVIGVRKIKQNNTYLSYYLLYLLCQLWPQSKQWWGSSKDYGNEIINHQHIKILNFPCVLRSFLLATYYLLLGE